MAEGVAAFPTVGVGGVSRGLHGHIVQWLVDNFCIREGYSVPRCLMYEIYMETCGQTARDRVNPATFGKVENLLTSFWKSLQQDTVVLMTVPDVGQLFKCYDIQLYKGIEDILLHDFLEDVSIQYLKSVRLFSKRFKLWLLNALEGFPALLQISKLKEVTVFVKRLRRKTYLSNMAKTMRMVLKSSRRVSALKSDLHAVITQGALDVSEQALASDPSDTEDPENNTAMKCLSSVISLLGTSADLSVFLNCLSTHLQVFVFQEEYVSPSVEPPWVTLNHAGHSQCPVGVSDLVLSVLGFLVDTATGNKIQGLPFGSCLPISDGPFNNSTGTPFFYMTAKDPVVADLMKSPMASLSLPESEGEFCRFLLPHFLFGLHFAVFLALMLT
ncbi:DNA-binding protein RFX8 [Tupaia chinensis]|uniref:DNA-binding protein RFX8 n=1 Tax=Tupaia chinensis TaxID=246437 RepID=L8Y562_TUPCH|nr:DNA-binding protein RFX8 [Tupaia chinensis]